MNIKLFFKTFLEALINGLKKSWKLCLKILKFVIPIYFLVFVLKYTKVLDSISNIFAPIMIIFGLPGEVALPIIAADCINIYSALAILDNISLTVKELTILGTMIGICHTLPIEASVLKTLGMPRFLHILIRLLTAVIIGIFLNLVLWWW